MKSDTLPRESFREWLDRVNNRTRQPSPGKNGQQSASEKVFQRREWVLSPGSVENQAPANGSGNTIEILRETDRTTTNALQPQNINGHIANGLTCSSGRSSTHSCAASRERDNRRLVNGEVFHSGNGTLNRNQSENLNPIRQIMNTNNFGNGVGGNSQDPNAVQNANHHMSIDGNANNDQGGNGLEVGFGHAVGPHVEEIDPNIPAWATATPVEGYIQHPVAGLVMHPSFYDNRHLIELATQPRYIYDGEVDGPLCPVGKKCDHVKNCFEVRVRMAVLAYQRHHISFRDAEYIWSVSRSTIQRRKAAMENQSAVTFLLTPENTLE